MPACLDGPSLVRRRVLEAGGYRSREFDPVGALQMLGTPTRSVVLDLHLKNMTASIAAIEPPSPDAFDPLVISCIVNRTLFEGNIAAAHARSLSGDAGIICFAD